MINDPIERRMVRLILDRLTQADQALWAELMATVPAKLESEAMVAMASQHITQALALLELVGGERLARAIVLSRVPGGSIDASEAH